MDVGKHSIKRKHEPQKKCLEFGKLVDRTIYVYVVNNRRRGHQSNSKSQVDKWKTPMVLYSWNTI